MLLFLIINVFIFTKDLLILWKLLTPAEKDNKPILLKKTREHFNPEIIWIYRLYTRSVLLSILYSCELWYDLRTKDMHDLNTLPHFIYKDAMGLPKSTDIRGFGSDIFESLLWLLSMSSKIDKRKLELLRRLFNLETKTPIKIFFTGLFPPSTYLNARNWIFSWPYHDFIKIMIEYNLIKHLLSYLQVGNFSLKTVTAAVTSFHLDL